MKIITQVSLTSLEIAELTGKRHPDVKRDIQVQLGELGGVSKFAHTYKDIQNKEQTMYRLPKRECLILVSGYNVKLRASIIDRLQFLEDELKSTCQIFTHANIVVNVSDPRWRKAFYLGFEGRCFFTGAPLKEDAFHLDHLVPKSKGGQDVLENLALSSPAVNQSKSDSYSAVWSERTAKDLKELYAPAVLRHYHELGDQLVSKAFEKSPHLANPRFMEKLESLFGREHVRSLYASLLPGLNADISEKGFDMGISDFLKDCTTHHVEDFITTADMFSAYLIFCEESKIAPAGRHTFIKQLREVHKINTKRKSALVDGQQKLLSVFTNLKMVG